MGAAGGRAGHRAIVKPAPNVEKAVHPLVCGKLSARLKLRIGMLPFVGGLPVGQGCWAYNAKLPQVSILRRRAYYLLPVAVPAIAIKRPPNHRVGGELLPVDALLLAPLCNFLVALEGAGITGFFMTEQRMYAVVLLQLFKYFDAFAVNQRNASLATSIRELAVHIGYRLNNKAPMALAKVRVLPL